MKTPRLMELERALADYERLSSDEAVALRSRDFSTLARIQNLKPQFLQKILSLTDELRLDRSDAWFDARIAVVIEQERANGAVAAGALRQVSVELEHFDQVRHRLRDLGQAYGPAGRRGKQLLARI